MEHAHEPDAAARGPASDIDEQILVMWQALRANPSLDARWAMQVIDRLLDQRPRQDTPAALGLLPARDQPGHQDLRGPPQPGRQVDADLGQRRVGGV